MNLQAEQNMAEWAERSALSCLRGSRGPFELRRRRPRGKEHDRPRVWRRFSARSTLVFSCHFLHSRRVACSQIQMRHIRHNVAQ